MDALIIGGGAAGLSAALVLGRARVETLLVDAGEQSNLPAHRIGGLLGQPATSPAELYATGRAQLAELPAVALRGGRVVVLAAAGDAFTATLEDGGTVSARRLLLASGMRYALPDVPGLAALWGDTAFMCPYCHGWEHRDERIGLLGSGGLEHRLPLLRTWSTDLVELGDDVASVAPGVVRYPDGREVAVDAIHVAATLEPRDGLAASLGLATTGNPLGTGFVVADEWGQTSAPGVFAAGDVVMGRNVAQAIATGNLAAAGLHRSIIL